MDEQRRRELVERGGFTFNGARAYIGGWRNEIASVSTPGNAYLCADWEAVEKAAQSGGAIPPGAVWEVEPHRPDVVDGKVTCSACGLWQDEREWQFGCQGRGKERAA